MMSTCPSADTGSGAPYLALPINEWAMSVELVHEFLKEICVRSGLLPDHSALPK